VRVSRRELVSEGECGEIKQKGARESEGERGRERGEVKQEGARERRGRGVGESGVYICMVGNEGNEKVE
jgi:hypothetical protein